MFVPFLGAVHLFDWDEINFAECAREMIVTGDYNTVQIDFQPFWEKPPLFIWMQVICMKIFGVTEFAARLPNAICGSITLAALFVLGSRISGRKFAWYWVLFYAGSLLPHFYFRSGIIDPWFNLFILLAIYHFVIYTNDQSPLTVVRTWDRRIILSGLFLSLAVLTKGPAAILIFGLCFIVARIWKRKRILLWKHFAIYAVVAIIPAGAWFLSLVFQGKTNVIIEFIEYQLRLFSTEDAGHGHNFFYHWIVLLIGCFPVSVFALQGLFKNGNVAPFEKQSLLWMRILFWVVLILFSIVKTKIIHYSSLCYFPLTFLGAHAAVQLESAGFSPKKWIAGLLLVIGGIIGAALWVIPYFDTLVPAMIERGWIADPFAAASVRGGSDWLGIEWLIGAMLIGFTLYSVWMYLRLNSRKAVYSLAIGGIVTVSAACIAIIPRVEGYTQRSAIEFWKSKANEKCFVETLGYKSYAHFFYANTQPPDESSRNLFNEFLKGKSAPGNDPELLRNYKRDWLLTGEIDRPAYFVCKNTYVDEVEKYWPHIRKIGEENGFVFWERQP